MTSARPKHQQQTKSDVQKNLHWSEAGFSSTSLTVMHDGSEQLNAPQVHAMIREYPHDRPPFFSCRKNNHAALLLIWVPTQSHFAKAAADWMTSWLRTDPFTITTAPPELFRADISLSRAACAPSSQWSDELGIARTRYGFEQSSSELDTRRRAVGHRPNLTARAVEQSTFRWTWSRRRALGWIFEQSATLNLGKAARWTWRDTIRAVIILLRWTLTALSSSHHRGNRNE